MNKKELFELQDCLDSAMTLVGTYQKLIAPLLDPYFRGLSSSDIAEPAKKSIRLTEENRRLEEALEEIEVLADNSFEQINKIVEIIKKVKQVKN